MAKFTNASLLGAFFWFLWGKHFYRCGTNEDDLWIMIRHDVVCGLAWTYPCLLLPKVTQKASTCEFSSCEPWCGCDDRRCRLRDVQPPLMKSGALIPPGQKVPLRLTLLLLRVRSEVAKHNTVWQRLFVMIISPTLSSNTICSRC